jgi:N-methylhydantoinase B/oxoprolinase/acetone carboxylase alpha subunit
MGVTCVMTSVDHDAVVQATVWGGRNPSAGWCGGSKGRPNRIEIRAGRPGELIVGGGDSLETTLAAGQRVKVVRGGGGGWGDPLDRDPRLVREDVIDEYVSVDGARRDYGVVLDPVSSQIDQAATEAERSRRRREPAISPAEPVAGAQPAPTRDPPARREPSPTIRTTASGATPAAQGGRHS